MNKTENIYNWSNPHTPDPAKGQEVKTKYYSPTHGVVIEKGIVVGLLSDGYAIRVSDSNVESHIGEVVFGLRRVVG